MWKCGFSMKINFGPPEHLLQLFCEQKLAWGAGNRVENKQSGPRCSSPEAGLWGPVTCELDTICVSCTDVTMCL